jgi:K+-sensing histidine kinase KdpD
MSSVSPEGEIASLRQNLNMLNSQIRVGRIDQDFLAKQIDRMSKLLERLETERRESRKYSRYEALYEISKTLGTSLDVQVVLDQVMDAIIKLTGAERAFLMLQDDDGGLSISAARGFDQQTLDNENSRYSRTVANQVLDTGTPLLTTNASEDPRFSQQVSILTQSLRSVMATPLRARGLVIGVTYVDSRAIAGLFSTDDLDALDALCGQAAIAIDNARLFNATDQQLALRVEELRQLRRIDLLLNQTLDTEKAMAYTLEWACRVADATGGHLALLEGDPPYFRSVQHYGEQESAEGAPLEQVHPQIWDVVKSGETTQFTNPHDGVGVIVPIRRENTVVGVVVLEKHTSFSPEQQDLVERIVARAAIAIENARLYDAVRAADLAKSEFVGIVAHDLKTPMNSIGGYSELMLMQAQLTDKQRDYLKKIKDTVRRMEILVSDLADISRIESGHFFMDKNRVLVEDVVQALKDNVLPQIEERKHQWVEKIAPNLPMIEVDYYRLLQVLTNLVTNAYKYTPDGGVVTLEVTRSEKGIRFSVSDTGIGLSEEGVRMLGTKFWRAEDRYTRSQPGTGLGFAITRSLVEQMGSKIEIKSKLGEGSTFSFELAEA